jgi:hypothetical protein
LKRNGELSIGSKRSKPGAKRQSRNRLILEPHYEKCRIRPKEGADARIERMRGWTTCRSQNFGSRC